MKVLAKKPTNNLVKDQTLGDILGGIHLSVLVDDLGYVRAQIADLKKREERMSATLKESGLDNAEGKYYKATVTEEQRKVLDQKKIKETMGPEWCEENSVTIPMFVLRVTKKPDFGIDEEGEDKLSS